MNAFGLILLGVAGFMLFAIFILILRLLDRRNRLGPWRLPVALGLVLVSYLGFSATLDRQPTHPGTVVNRWIHLTPLAPTGGALHFYFVDVDYTATPDSYPQRATIWVDEATYDQLPVDTPVQIRTWQPREPFEFARLGRQRTWSGAFWRRVGILLAVLLAVTLVRVLLRRQGRHEQIRSMGLAVALAGLAILGVLLWLMLAPEPTYSYTAPAQVVDADLHLYVENDATRGDLAQPFAVVRVSFVPAGRAAPEESVDIVDLRPAETLVAGDTVVVGYDPDAPRGAKLAGRTRTYRWRNPVANVTGYLVALLTSWLFWVIAVGAGWLTYRRYARPS